MRRLVILVLLSLLNTDAAHCQQTSVTPADFNFVLRYGASAELVLDTFNGTFTRDADQPKHTLTVDLKLTPGEMNEVFRALARIDFWNDTKYPKLFSYPPPTPGERGTRVTPCGLYNLSVRSNGRVKELSWENCWLSKTPPYVPGDELREVFETIHRLITLKPEYRALPRSQAPPRPI